MFAIAVTLALFGFTVAMLASMATRDGQKILAALQGQSWATQPPVSARPLTLRVSPRYPASRPVRAQPLRAAA